MAAALSVPQGNPDALEQLASRVEFAAQGAGSLGSRTGQFTTTVLSEGRWTGEAATAFGAYGANLGEGASAAESPLADIAAAVRGYAGSLRTAQQAAQAYTSLAEAAQNDSSGSLMSAAEQAGQNAVAAIDAMQEAGDKAAAQVTSAAGDLQNLFGKGPVQGFIADQPGLGEGLPLGGWTPGDPLPGDLGPEILGNPGAPDLGLPVGDPVPPDLGPEILGNPGAPDLGLPVGDPVPPDLGPEILGNPGALLGPLINFNKPQGEEPQDGESPGGNEAPGDDVVSPRDVHGADRTGSRGVDVPFVKEDGELYFQSDGQMVRVLDNGNGTSDVVIYDPSNPSGAPTTTIKDMPESQVQARIDSGRWFG